MGTIARTDYMSLESVVVVVHDAADLRRAAADGVVLEAARAHAAVEVIRGRFPPDRDKSTRGFDAVVIVEVS